MGKECIPRAITVPSLNKRSECGYFSPCKQGKALAGNGVQTLECIHKDILKSIQRQPGTQNTTVAQGGFPRMGPAGKVGTRPCFGSHWPTSKSWKMSLRLHGMLWKSAVLDLMWAPRCLLVTWLLCSSSKADCPGDPKECASCVPAHRLSSLPKLSSSRPSLTFIPFHQEVKVA